MTNILLFTVLLFSSLNNFCFQNTETNLPIKTTEKMEKFQIEKLSAKGQTAYQNLLNAERFEDSFIGYAGSYSVLVKSLNDLSKEKKADEAFKALLNEAKIAGQLYALNGLYYTDHEFFKKAVEKYRDDSTLVNRMSGCEISNEKVSDIIESKSPVVAKLLPNETMEDFWKRNKVSYEIDIINGGFPATFRAADSRKDK
jgi:hypothetical protein